LRSWFYALSAVTLAAFSVLFLWTAHSVFILNNTDIYVENGLLENIQAILLIISCIVFLIPIAVEKNPEKLILLFCSLLCYSFILREVDFDELDVNDTIKYFFSGVFRNISITVAFIVLFSCAAFRFSYYINASISFIRSKSGILLMSGGFLLITGDLLEKSSSIIHHVYWEELLELCGCCFILLSAFAANAGLTGKKQPYRSSSPPGRDE
jgi:hypothetical protein